MQDRTIDVHQSMEFYFKKGSFPKQFDLQRVILLKSVLTLFLANDTQGTKKDDIFKKNSRKKEKKRANFYGDQLLGIDSRFNQKILCIEREYGGRSPTNIFQTCDGS